MPNKLRTPSYRLHKPSARAVVTLEGKVFYLGPYGTKTSRDEYDRVIAEWLANGRRIPSLGPPPLSVNEIILRYYGYCKTHYANRRTVTSMLSRIRCALRPLARLFEPTPAAAFGPRSLMLVREEHIASGLARKTVNDNVQAIKRMFRWAVREELVPPAVHNGLSAVDGLRSGESDARAGGCGLTILPDGTARHVRTSR